MNLLLLEKASRLKKCSDFTGHFGIYFCYLKLA